MKKLTIFIFVLILDLMVCPAFAQDSDDDGIPDNEDNCPASILDPTVIIDGCDSGVENQLFDDGCTMNPFSYIALEIYLLTCINFFSF